MNNKRYRQLNTINDNCYEVTLAKAVIKKDIPHHVAFFILSYAKLRMLEFYYDFMLFYFDIEDFCYCHMDTDSAYMALSGDMETIVKPHLREHFFPQSSQMVSKRVMRALQR